VDNLSLLVNDVLGIHRQRANQRCEVPAYQRNRLQQWDTADEQGSYRLNRVFTASVLVMKVQRGSHVYGQSWRELQVLSRRGVALARTGRAYRRLRRKEDGDDAVA
jgi:hypothetical protein